MNVRLFETAEDWGELESQWNSLLHRSDANTIFLTWEWLHAWWSAYGAGRELCVLGVYDGGELVGIAPLCIATKNNWSGSYRSLHFIGDTSNDSDYLSFIVAEGREVQVVNSILEYLSSEDTVWDVAELDGPLHGSQVTRAVMEAVRRMGWELSHEPIPCATLPLPDRWDDYLQTLKPRFRGKVRSALGFFDKELKSAPQGCCRQEQIEPWLEVMFDLHTRRWRSRGQPGVFGDQAKRSFYAEISKSAMRNGWLALHRLDWGERPLALQYGFQYDSRFYLLQEGYDPDFENIRPGLSLRAWLIRHWIEKGFKEYDFLAGQSAYKFEWGGQPKASTKIRIGKKPRAKFFYFRIPQGVAAAKNTMRRLVPEKVLARRRALINGRHNNQTHSSSPTVKTDAKLRSLALMYSLQLVRALGSKVSDNYQAVQGRQGLSILRRDRPVCQILQFHRVNDDEDPFFPATPVSVFRQQMEYLARNYRVVSLDDLVSGAAFDRAAKFSVAITFDDGYRDNYLYAFPILKQLQLPATIFLATGYVDAGQLPWYDQVCLAFKLTSVPAPSFAAQGGPGGAIAQRAARLQLLDETLRWLRGMDERERSSALRAIFSTLHAPPQLNLPNAMLSWSEIRQMQPQGIAFGGHTVWHPALSRLPRNRLEEELLGCKETIEEQLQKPVRHFAYPFGKYADIGATAKNVVRQCGYESAVTTVWGFNTREQDLLELRRCTPWESEIDSFALKLDWNRFFVAEDTASLDREPVLSANNVGL